MKTMGSAALANTGKMTVEEYLDFDRASDTRYEYHDGDIFPIEAASLRHGRISINIRPDAG